MRRLNIVVALLVALGGTIIVSLPSCGGGTGVCTGCCGPTGRTYCKDDWTETECADWNAQEVDGVSWQFFGGQTCDERGTPATP